MFELVSVGSEALWEAQVLWAFLLVSDGHPVAEHESLGIDHFNVISSECSPESSPNSSNECFFVPSMNARGSNVWL